MRIKLNKEDTKILERALKIINNKAKATFLYFTRIHLNNILEYLNYFIRNLDKNLSKSVINV